jgi:DNA-binding LacI/PurR family transcriptional regulator
MLGASEAAAQQNYSLLLWPHPKDEQELLQMLRKTAVDGLILMDIRLYDTRVDLLKEHQYPFSMIGHRQNNDGLSFVDFDFADAVQTCVRYLADLGHRHLLFVHAAAPAGIQLGYARRSLHAFQQITADCGLQGSVLECRPDIQHCYSLIDDALTRSPSLSAAITVDAWMIGTIIQILAKRGLKIPEDFSLMTVASSQLATITTPRLTTVTIPYAEMGRIGTDMLIRHLEGETEPVQRMLKGNLSINQSSGPPRTL